MYTMLQTIKLATVLVILLCAIQSARAATSTCETLSQEIVTAFKNTATNASVLTWHIFTSDKATYKSADATAEENGLGSYYNMVRGFCKTALSDVPIVDVMNVINNKVEMGTGVKELVTANFGYLIAIAVGFLFFLIFPIVGMCFCCCRCCGNCGGRMEQKYDPSAGTKRIIFSIILFVLSVFAGMGAVLIYVSIDHLVPAKALDTAIDSLDDTQAFVDVISDEMNHATTENFNFTHEVLLRDLDNIGHLLGVPVRTKLGTEADLTQVFTSVSNFKSTIDIVADKMIAVNTSLANVKAKAQVLSSDLQAVKTTLDAMKADTAGACPGTTCASVDTSSLTTDFDPATMPDISSDVAAINDAKNMDMATLITEAQADFDDIPCRVKNDSLSSVQSIKTTISDFEADSLQTIDLSDIKTGTKSLTKFKDQLRDYSDMSNQYNDYKGYGGIGLASLCLFIVILQLFGLLLGLISCDSKALPTQRSALSNAGGILLMASVGFIFLFGWLLMLFTTLMFAIGAPAQSWICQPLSDLDSPVFKQVEDAVGEKNFLGDMLFKNKSVAMTVQGLLKDCKDNKPAYTAMKLNNLFDLDADLNMTGKINIDEEMSNLVVSFADVKLLTPNLEKQLLDTKSAATIDYAAFNTELNKAATSTDLSTYATNLRATAALPATTAAAKSAMDGAADDLDTIQAGSKQDLDNAKILRQFSIRFCLNLTDLKAKLSDLQTTSASVPADVDSLILNLKNSENTLNNSGPGIVKELANVYGKELLRVMEEYMNYTIKTVKSDMGRCKPLYDIYNSLVKVALCGNFITAFNGIWFAIGWSLFFLVFTIVFAVKMAKHFRRMNYSSQYNSYNDNMAKPPLLTTGGVGKHRGEVGHADKVAF